MPAHPRSVNEALRGRCRTPPRSRWRALHAPPWSGWRRLPPARIHTAGTSSFPEARAGRAFRAGHHRAASAASRTRVCRLSGPYAALGVRPCRPCNLRDPLLRERVLEHGEESSIRLGIAGGAAHHIQTAVRHAYSVEGESRAVPRQLWCVAGRWLSGGAAREDDGSTLFVQACRQGGIRALRARHDERDEAEQGLAGVRARPGFIPAIFELRERDRFLGGRSIAAVRARARDDLDVVAIRLAGDGRVFRIDSQGAQPQLGIEDDARRGVQGPAGGYAKGPRKIGAIPGRERLDVAPELRHALREYGVLRRRRALHGDVVQVGTPRIGQRRGIAMALHYQRESCNAGNARAQRRQVLAPDGGGDAFDLRNLPRAAILQI